MAGSPMVDLAGNWLFPFGLGKWKIFVTEIKGQLKGSPARHVNASRYFPWRWLATVALTSLYLKQAMVPSLFLAE